MRAFQGSTTRVVATQSMVRRLAGALRGDDRCVRANLPQQARRQLAGALAVHEPAALRREEAHGHARARREARDVGRAGHGAADDLGLRDGGGEPAEAGAGAQLTAERARALGEHADAGARAQLLDRPVERPRIAGAAVDRDLAHAVEHAVEAADLPERRLRERLDLAPWQP